MYNKLQANVLLVEYRGYGDSDDATPSEKGLRLDAEGALQFITGHSEIDRNRVFLFGRSLGGAVAFHLGQYAERNSIPLAGIMVENTFLSISRMVDHLMPMVAPFKALILRIGWNSYEIAPTLKTPVLYLAGAADQLVPHLHMLELFKASGESSTCARLHVVKKGTHNETWVQGGQRYWDAILNFINEVFASSEVGGSFRSFEDIPQDRPSSKGVTIGEGSDVSTQASSIPIMPSNLIGMAIEATSSVLPSQKASVSDASGNKKKL
jgi:abhydrolase domain-containing protein 13